MGACLAVDGAYIYKDGTNISYNAKNTQVCNEGIKTENVAA